MVCSFTCNYSKASLSTGVLHTINGIILLMLITLPAKAQLNIDSVHQVVKETSSDSIRAKALATLAVQTTQTNPQKALEYGSQALEIAQENGLQKIASEVSTSLGIIYYGLGDYEKTLDYFFQTQSFYEAMQDTLAMSRSYNNIGLVLVDLDRTREAIKYHKLSLKMKLTLDDLAGVANSYSNLGLAYQNIDSLDIAMDYYKKAVAIDKKRNDIYGIYTSYSNIGKNHFMKQSYDSAAYYYGEAIMLSDQVSNKQNKAELLKDYALLDAAQKRYDRAIEKFNTSILLSEEIEAKLIIKDCYEGLSQTYQEMGNLEQSIHYFRKCDSIKELIFNENQSNKIAEIETNYKIQKGQKEIELLKKESEIKDLRLVNSQYIMYFLVACLGLVALLVFLQHRKNLYKTRTNKILKNQNRQIIEKNRNIMDSILYAKNIQQAILPSGDKLKNIFADAFVFSKARDVVNGDFYWFTQKDDKIIIAAVDCTGHGVPAAFLNVMGNSHLYNIVVEHNILEPSEILNQLNKRIIESLHSNRLSKHSDNGMDVGLCLFDKSTRKLQFAGAKRPLYYFHNKELSVLKGDAHPVGGEAYEENRTFTQHELELSANDSFYLFTDGIVDQFGGDNDKKFMYPRLRQVLNRVFNESMEHQLMAIKDELYTWKGNNEQTDDILIIGLRV